MGWLLYKNACRLWSDIPILPPKLFKDGPHQADSNARRPRLGASTDGEDQARKTTGGKQPRFPLHEKSMGRSQKRVVMHVPGETPLRLL